MQHVRPSTWFVMAAAAVLAVFVIFASNADANTKAICGLLVIVLTFVCTFLLDLQSWSAVDLAEERIEFLRKRVVHLAEIVAQQQEYGVKRVYSPADPSGPAAPSRADPRIIKGYWQEFDELSADPWSRSLRES